LTNRPQNQASEIPPPEFLQPPRRKHFDVRAWGEDIRTLSQFLNTNAWPLVFAIGLSLRLLGLIRARSFWLDESMLLVNIEDVSPIRIIGPLKQEQVAPPGFLMTLRAIHYVFGSNVVPLRIPAFLAGTLAFVLFALWARRTLPAPVAWLSAWLMALNADALYYCQEMKPYAFDLLAMVVMTMLIDRHANETGPVSIDEQPPRFRQRSPVWAFFLIIPWFSIASVFPAVAFFTTQGLFGRNDRRKLQDDALLACAWSVSFLSAWSIERTQVIKGSVLWNFWDFAFLKLTRPIDSLCVLADNFLNPLHLATSINSPWVMFPWIAILCSLLFLGIFRMFKSMPKTASFAILSTCLVAVASLARAYPFHGRTIVFLLPFALTAFSFGLASIPIRKGPLRSTIVILLLIVPTSSPLIVEPFTNGRLTSFDGDLEHDHFTLHYGVIKRANQVPKKLERKPGP
jgi:hypothetical protein